MKQLMLKRVYAPPTAGDGTRILVDRLWPRGLSKDKAKIGLWLRDISPSNELRKRLHSRPDDWAEFCTEYYSELTGAAAQVVAKILFDQLSSGPVTLLYAARNEKQNNAVALKAWLDREMRRKR